MRCSRRAHFATRRIGLTQYRVRSTNVHRKASKQRCGACGHESFLFPSKPRASAASGHKAGTDSCCALRMKPIVTRGGCVASWLSIMFVSASCSGESESMQLAAPPVITRTPERTPSHPTCGLSVPEPIDLMPVIYGNHVVVSRSLHSVRLQGTARLTHEPDDFVEYYEAASSVERASLPTQMDRLLGTQMRSLSSPTGCRPTLRRIFASAWVQAGWAEEGSPLRRAQQTFRNGTGFLVAEVEPDCPVSQGDIVTTNLTAELHYWQVRSLTEEHDSPDRTRLIAKGVAALRTEPALAAQNALYESFRSRAGIPFPEHWWSLPDAFVRWSYATDGNDALLIVKLNGYASSENPYERFAAQWLGVWCVNAEGELVSLGPDTNNGIAYDHTSREVSVIGTSGSLPMILDSYYALRPLHMNASPENGRYQHYEYTLPPPSSVQ